MRTKIRSRFSLLFIALAALIAIPAGMAIADVLTNDLDAIVDNTAETMPLQVGGSTGTSTLYVLNTNDKDTLYPDPNKNCNLAGNNTAVTLAVSSSDTSVATVAPSSITIDSCDENNGKDITVTPKAKGSATISATLVSTTAATGSTFYMAPATFTVNVSDPPNTPPTISMSGVTGGVSYEKGSVPTATCSVVDKEDGNSDFNATLSTISGPLAASGLGEQTATCSYTDKGGILVESSKTYNIVDTTKPVISDTPSP